jgi:hypothetical protein
LSFLTNFKGIKNLPESDEEEAGFLQFSLFSQFPDWTKFEKKKKEKLNRKEQRTRDLIKTDSLIFSCSQEVGKHGRRRFYGNLRWHKLDLKSWLKGDLVQQYYRNIRRPIMNCKNSIKCPADMLPVT